MLIQSLSIANFTKKLIPKTRIKTPILLIKFSPINFSKSGFFSLKFSIQDFLGINLSSFFISFKIGFLVFNIGVVLVVLLIIGAPPHGGLAFGLDRLVAILGGQETIRDFIAFPKNNSGRDVMIDAPAFIDDDQLKELSLKLNIQE